MRIVRIIITRLVLYIKRNRIKKITTAFSVAPILEFFDGKIPIPLFIYREKANIGSRFFHPSYELFGGFFFFFFPGRIPKLAYSRAHSREYYRTLSFDGVISSSSVRIGPADDNINI